MNQRKAPEASNLGVVDGLVQLSFLIQAVLGRVAAQYELTVVQMRLLGILRGREPAMLELARILNLDKSSVSGLIDRAERRGLVERMPLAADGRVVRVRLTSDGRRLAEEGAVEVGRQINTVVAGLPETGRAELTRLIGEILLTDADRRGLDLSTRLGATDE